MKDKYEIVVEYLLNNQEKFYHLAYSYTGNQEGAMDIVQNATCKLLEKYESIRDIAFIKTWFYRVLVNECMDYLRKGKREFPYAPEELPESYYEEPGFADGYDLYTAINQLPKEIKTVILLRYYEDMSLKEIAEVTETKLSTVKTRLYSGLEKLKRSVEEMAI